MVQKTRCMQQQPAAVVTSSDDYYKDHKVEERLEGKTGVGKAK